jgi:ribosomal protein S24E
LKDPKLQSFFKKKSGKNQILHDASGCDLVHDESPTPNVTLDQVLFLKQQNMQSLFPQKPGRRNVVVLAHHDLDGNVSRVSVSRLLGEIGQFEGAQTVISQLERGVGRVVDDVSGRQVQVQNAVCMQIRQSFGHLQSRLSGKMRRSTVRILFHGSTQIVSVNPFLQRIQKKKEQKSHNSET